LKSFSYKKKKKKNRKILWLAVVAHACNPNNTEGDLEDGIWGHLRQKVSDTSFQSVNQARVCDPRHIGGIVRRITI
jgi:hypothetical protein